jgi:RNA polymerase sigma factor (sigma-70 family)
MYRYVALRVPREDAEDVTHAVLERGLRYRGSYDDSKGAPTAWLAGIGNRVIAQYFADKAQSASSPQAEPSGDKTRFDDQTHLRLDLQDAIATLSDRDRELIALRYGADLRAREIALLLDMETHAVEVALARSLDRLRKIVPANEDRDD